MQRLLIIYTFLIAYGSLAQESITLNECYSLVLKNYPLAQQSQLLELQNKLETDVISIAKLPQFNLDAQATYQSDVIELPIPNLNIEAQNKDQYRATLSVNQLLYNGGATNAALQLKEVQLKTKQQQVQVNLFQLKQQINQLYFSVLLTQEAHSLLTAKQKQLQTNLNDVQSGIKNGVVLPASDKVLEAELLKLKQQFTELENNKTHLTTTLESLIGQPIPTGTSFENTKIRVPLETELTRPELSLFEYKQEEIESNVALIAKQNAPKLLGFAMGGYGNPGLNMLDNSFQPFYTVGVKLNWKVFDWNATKKQRQSLAINKNIIATETETFKLNTKIAIDKQQKEIAKIEDFIATDIEIITLRKEVLQSADSQLKNGVITTSAYITELTNLFEDENMLATHKIQLQLAKANYNVLKGN